MQEINRFILEYIFFPGSMLGFVFFMAAMIRSTVRDWLRERQEKRAGKNQSGGVVK